jgi:AcrR family transcriptional regulator
MARSKAFDVDITLQKALAEFRSKGYSGASIADLLAAMKLNRASMYATYGNKEDLFCQVLEFYIAQQKEDFNDLIESGQNARKRIESLLRNCYKEDDGSPRMAGCLVLTSLAEFSVFSLKIQDMCHEYIYFVKHHISEWVEMELERIGRRPEDGPVLAAQIFNSWVTLQMLGRGGMEATMLEQLAESAVQGLDVTTAAPRLYLHLQTAVEEAALVMQDESVQEAARYDALPWHKKMTKRLTNTVSTKQVDEIGVFKFLFNKDSL